MRTIKLIIQYDGTNYSGWQEQANAPSIQETVELALKKIVGIRLRVQGAGRTDAGVHAAAMPALFRTESNIPLKGFVDGLNSHLPPDIAIQSAVEVPPDFRIIGGARSKTYRYTIYNSPIRSPLEHRRTWFIRTPLDLNAMQLGAAYFVGEHDFAAFKGQNCTAVTTVRRVDAVLIGQNGPLVTIDVTGGGFLKNMVRIMVGTLVGVGQKRFKPEQIQTFLQGCDRTASGVTAPPQGLCLMEVIYPDDIRLLEQIALT